MTRSKANERDIIGTSLVGYIDASFKEMVEIFGEPERYENSKLQVEWSFKLDGTIVTLYDYKNDLPPHLTTHWHIGGKSQKAVRKLLEYANENYMNYSNIEGREFRNGKIQTINY